MTDDQKDRLTPEETTEAVSGLCDVIESLATGHGDALHRLNEDLVGAKANFAELARSLRTRMASLEECQDGMARRIQELENERDARSGLQGDGDHD